MAGFLLCAFIYAFVVSVLSNVTFALFINVKLFIFVKI